MPDEIRDEHAALAGLVFDAARPHVRRAAGPPTRLVTDGRMSVLSAPTAPTIPCPLFSVRTLAPPGSTRAWTWRRSLGAGGLVVAGLVAAGCTRPAADASARQTIRLTTGVPGGFFHPLGAALVNAYSRVLPEYAFDVVPSGGAVNDLAVLQRGGADLGLAFADVTYLAFVGRLDEEPTAFDQLRGVAVLQLTVVHVIVRPGSGITSIGQLGGRAVALGPIGSGTAATAKVLLRVVRSVRRRREGRVSALRRSGAAGGARPARRGLRQRRLPGRIGAASRPVPAPTCSRSAARWSSGCAPTIRSSGSC